MNGLTSVELEDCVIVTLPPPPPHFVGCHRRRRRRPFDVISVKHLVVMSFISAEVLSLGCTSAGRPSRAGIKADATAVFCRKLR